MIKRILKRILMAASVLCLVLACVPTVSIAVDPVSGSMALAGAIDAYGMAYGVGTVYDVSSSSGVTSSFEGLWDEFSEYQSNAGSQFDYDSFIDDYNQNRSLYGFEHSSGNFAAWSIDAESAEIFDQFWNWLLTGPAEMTRVDNEYFQFSSPQIGPDSAPIHVGYFNGVFPGQPLSLYNSSSSDFQNFSNSLKISDPYVFNSSTYQYGVLSSVPNTYVFIYGSYLVWCSLSSSFTRYLPRRVNDTYNGSYQSSSTVSSTSISGVTVYFSEYISANVVNRNQYLPVFSSLDVGLSAALSFMDGSVIPDSVGVKAYGDGYVDIPDPTKPDYVPTPLEIVTNIPWDSTYDDTDEEDGLPVPFPPVDVPLVVDDILTSISAEDYALEEDPQDPDPDAPPPAPSEVFVPLLPVGLPSFNFSLSGIWHYVREWVASLGAWFSTMFTIWSALPYAMVVPVYATAVVVIVLGLYKRFFM